MHHCKNSFYFRTRVAGNGNIFIRNRVILKQFLFPYRTKVKFSTKKLNYLLA